MSKVIIVGSINMDVVAFAPRLPKGGETVMGRSLQFLPGGKGANQAVASARLGTPTQIVGRVGSDAFGKQMIDFLREEAVAVDGVNFDPVAGTGVAIIAVDDHGENAIVVVPGANMNVGGGEVMSIEARKGDVMVAQLEIPEETVRAAFIAARRLGATTILNAAPAKHLTTDLLAHTDVLVVNETELGFFQGRDAVAIEDAIETARLVRSHVDQALVITLGANGAMAIVGDHVVRVAGRRVEAVDTTGAGDCFVGALASRIAAGSTLESAMRLANDAAALCVQRIGAGVSMPTVVEINNEYGAHNALQARAI